MNDQITKLEECSESMRALASVIRQHGTCAPSALESVAAKADAAIALMRGQSWQPIETAPKEEGLKILGASNAPWTQDYYPVLVYEGQRFGSNKQYFGWYAPFDHDDRAPDPTHWQPLPAPPKDSADEQ